MKKPCTNTLERLTMSERRRIVLDTNCLIASLSRHGKYYSVWRFAANASYIVSDDKHFNILREVSFPKISVIKLQQFLATLIEQVN